MVKAMVPEAGLAWIRVLPATSHRVTRDEALDVAVLRFLVYEVGLTHGPLRRFKRGPFREAPGGRPEAGARGPTWPLVHPWPWEPGWLTGCECRAQCRVSSLQRGAEAERRKRR